MMRPTRSTRCSRCNERQVPEGRDFGYGAYGREGTRRTCPRDCGCDGTHNVDDIRMRIKEIDFALADTILYLDVYPCKKEALEYYHKLLCTRRTLVEMYEDASGPLTAYGNVSPTEWNWVKSPWPWEFDAN